MKRWLALLLAALVVAQPIAALAADASVSGPDTRLYLTDGTVVEGYLVERSDDLVIIKVNNEVFTFEPAEIRNIVTVDSLGGAAATVSVIEFPYISFLGGAAAFSLVSWLQFDRASDKETEAELNREAGQLGTASDLDDEAHRARIYGWGCAVMAVGSLAVALVPRRSTRRVFPSLTMQQGEPTVGLAYVYQF